MKELTPVQNIGVYFYDDHGGVQTPKSWHVEVPEGKGWTKLKIYNTDEYATLADVYNTVRPAKKLSTRKLRIVMTPKHDGTTVGILSVNIESESK